jgi:hypothetical protein
MIYNPSLCSRAQQFWTDEMDNMSEAGWSDEFDNSPSKIVLRGQSPGGIKVQGALSFASFSLGKQRK